MSQKKPKQLTLKGIGLRLLAMALLVGFAIWFFFLGGKGT